MTRPFAVFVIEVRRGALLRFPRGAGVRVRKADPVTLEPLADGRCMDTWAKVESKPGG